MDYKYCLKWTVRSVRGVVQGEIDENSYPAAKYSLRPVLGLTFEDFNRDAGMFGQDYGLKDDNSSNGQNVEQPEKRR